MMRLKNTIAGPDNAILHLRYSSNGFTCISEPNGNTSFNFLIILKRKVQYGHLWSKYHSSQVYCLQSGIAGAVTVRLIMRTGP